ncbi:MAG: hypothetical protein ACNS64_06610, partial [Candidatus Halalkalibacterium sp. M3_1C_030]
MLRLNKFLTLLTLVLFCFAFSLTAQDKKILEPENYGQWQSITATDYSDDGNWFAYNISLVDGDGWLMIKKVGSDSTGEHKFMHGINAEFSENNRWAAFQIGVSEDKQEKLEEQKKKVKYKLGLMNLSTAKVDTFENIQSFEFSDTGSHLVMTKYKPEDQKSGGNDLLVYDLNTRQNQLIGNVSEHAFNDKGTLLAVAIDALEKLGNGVQLLNLENRSMTVLQSDTADFKDLTWSEEENALAFLKSEPNEDYEDKTHRIYAYQNLPGTMQPKVFNQAEYNSFPEAHRVVDYRDLQWSEDRATLFLGIKKWEKKEKPEKKEDKEDQEEAKSDTTKKEDKPKDLNEGLDSTNVEIWHWRDDQIQPRQEVLKNQLKQDNHLSAWHLEDNTFVQLGDSLVENVQLTGDQKHAVGYVEKPYEPTFEEEWRDIYLIDVRTGEKEKILERREFVNTSPGG